jgi:energy-converting hydrogenase A subunit M
MEKNKLQNKQSSVTSIKWLVHILEIVEMDDEGLYVPKDVLEEASAAKYQKELEKFICE